MPPAPPPVPRRHGLRTRWERLTRVKTHSAVTLGQLTERACKRLPTPSVEAQQPGDLVSIDAFSIGRLKGVGKVWPLAACSYAIAPVVPRVTAQSAVHFLRPTWCRSPGASATACGPC